MRRWIVRSLVVAALVAAALALRWTVFAPAPLALRSVAVERGRVESTVTNSKAGTVRARLHARLAPGVAGSVAELPLERGAAAARGELLLRIDDRLQRAQVALAERSAEVLQAELHLRCIARDRAARELERNRDLAQRGLVSADELDRLQSAAELAATDCTVAEAALERGRADVELARVELARTELRAPFDGVVSEVSTELGEWLALFPAVGVVELYDPSSLYVAAPMDEVDSGALRVGAEVKVTIDSHPGRAFAGRVARIAPYVLDVEQQNRTVELEVELDAADRAALRPGTSADVEVIVAARDGVLRLPTATLLEGQRVLLVADGRLVERAVGVGLRNWDWTEVTSGLAEGERVVSELDAPDLAPGRPAVERGPGASP